MNLNTTNITYILKRLSCCISNLGNKLYQYSKIGNKDCFEDIKDNILILNNIYDILNSNYNITYPTYQYYIATFPNPTVCVATIIDNTTNTILAIGYNTGVVTQPTSLYALIQAINNLYTNYPCYTGSSTVNKVVGKSGTTWSDGYLYLTNNCQCISNLSIHLYQPVVDTPPYTGINPYQVASEISTTNIQSFYKQGNCSNKKCFTKDQLNDLYQQSLNLCKDCNCN